MARSFVESNKDFVLKLKIEGSNGTTQIRRVRLPRIDDGAGNVSYDELVGIAITFIFPDDGSIEEPDNYRVVLSYTDVDQDLVTIASSDELVDAIEQFADEGVLRVSAEVRSSRKGKPTGRAKAAAPPCAAARSASSTSSSAAEDSSSPPPPPPLPRDPPVQHVLETFVGALSSAVSSFQDGKNRAKSASHPSDKKPPSVDEAVTEAAEFARKVSEEATNFSDELLRAFGEADQPNPPPAADRTSVNPTGEPVAEVQKKTVEEVPAIVAKKSDEKSPVVEPAASKEPPKDETMAPDIEEEEEPEEPFIHARHTCDGCLMTPIVGKRYHAINIADYDLCAKCYGNYSGTEFVFEAVELDRDRAFQEKWRRRREKILARSGRGRFTGRNRRGRFSVFGRPHPPPPPHAGPFPPPPPPPPPHAGPFPPPPPPPHHHPFGPPHHGHGPPPPHNPPPPHHGHGLPPPFFQNPWARPPAAAPVRNEVEEDEDLKEAIRRSLCENVPKVAEEAPRGSDETMSATASVATAKTAKSEETEGSKSDDGDIEAPASVAEPEENQPPSEEPEPEIVIPVMNAPIVAGVETVTDDDESIGSDDSFDDFKPAAKKPAPFSPSAESFATDADGEAAEAIGKTLDSFARVFDEMLQADAPRPVDNAASVADESKPESVSVAASGAVIVEAAGGDEQGDILLGPSSYREEDFLSERSSVRSATSSENEWHVVSGTGSVAGSVGSNKNDDNGIGRAAEMLGSALFNSDMKSSGEVISHLSQSSCSDSFSSASSVPSTIPSLSGPARVDRCERWASQLAKLREIGFNNDERCIEVMERLEAANIGVDSSEEITVAQVLNEMLK